MAANKTALITGSTSGIGQGIAEIMAENGFNIVLNGFGDKDIIADLQAKWFDDIFVNIELTKLIYLSP